MLLSKCIFLCKGGNMKIDGYVKFERVGKDKKQASVYPNLEK